MCSWMRCEDEVERYVVREKGKFSWRCVGVFCDMILCREGGGGGYCVWFEFVEEFLVVVRESSYADLFSSCELWDLIRFWYRVENAWWFFNNVRFINQLAERVHDDGNKRVGSFDGYAIPTRWKWKKISWQCLSHAIYSLSSLVFYLFRVNDNWNILSYCCSIFVAIVLFFFFVLFFFYFESFFLRLLIFSTKISIRQ